MASHHGNRGTKRRNSSQGPWIHHQDYSDVYHELDNWDQADQRGNVPENTGMAQGMAGEGSGGGGGSLVNPTIQLGASTQWDVTVNILGGANNALNTYDLFNLACEQTGNSFATRLASPQDARVPLIMGEVHNIDIVANNTNTILSGSFQHSSDGIMSTPMVNGDAVTAPSAVNSTLARPFFMIRKQHVQFPVTGSTTSHMYHNYKADKNSRPYVLDTDVAGRSYASIQAFQNDPSGADASWVARVRATFHFSGVLPLAAVMMGSNMDIRQNLKKEYREMIPEIEREQLCENDWIQKQIEAVVDRKNRETERIKMVKYKRMMGIDDDSSKF